ncbi:hypothetical protein E1265_01590 [Streptomyces sp. 8K308]|uniref:hypothetical protein n=1 Tax=Streptomyces sp. 8K308 TaxID=2530388 RepID=UPI001052C103|nr:hypothetical protein [Streptomyces sp. 8K308]TDC27411.1 hypothetical protein E1265_01590 [Streptomyces sp. 8K308]
MVQLIEVSDPNGAESVGHMLLRAWLQTYPNEDAGVDETWILEQRGSAVTAEGIGQWQQFIEETIRHPELLCRVVRSGAEIVGVLCGRRDFAGEGLQHADGWHDMHLHARLRTDRRPTASPSR